MRVLIVNTSERTGGAAVAANRLMDALNNNGVKAKMLVREKERGSLQVSGLSSRWWPQWCFLWERLCIWFHLGFRRSHLFELDMANIGTDITSLPEFLEADVIHLHWINQGMLSLGNICKILASGKPVVWTMHDIWPATAICHYARGCEAFHQQCRKCPILPKFGVGDLALRVWQRKQQMLSGHRVSYVACSQWLADEARKSALLDGQRVTSIPNPIDTRIFRPVDKQACRQQLSLPADKRIILFVSQRVTDPRKGMSYFVDALRLLAEQHPEMKQNTVVAILGGHAEDVARELSLPAYPLGYVSDTKRIVQVYNAADVFVLPSLEDNLPNTLMESMACGVPCVGFKVGGIPEMIDHQQNGYVAEFQQTDDLAAGIRYVLDGADYAVLSQQCQHKVAHSYSQQSVAKRYIEVYEDARRPKMHNR
ncbi:MAG: glycosyltransferase family 4 protein [Prevotella sp.]|nr:glycosyltransferase family 4 protein [Prevotella sp.]